MARYSVPANNNHTYVIVPLPEGPVNENLSDSMWYQFHIIVCVIYLQLYSGYDGAFFRVQKPINHSARKLKKANTTAPTEPMFSS